MNEKLFEIEPRDPVREQVEAKIAAALLITDDAMLEIVGASLGTVLCLLEDVREGYPDITLDEHEQANLKRASEVFTTYVNRFIGQTRSIVAARGSTEGPQPPNEEQQK